MPYDGDCMFSAISYQLQTNDVCTADSSELRQKVADHLEANALLYRNFLCQPVPSEDGSFIADTAQPTPEDELINSVSDPQLQCEMRWQKYVRCLRQGVWGDHITLQAIANMLSVKINVFSSNHPMFSVTPVVCSAECEAFLGLILQYHYVGLDKHPVCGVQSTVDVQSNTSDHTDNAVDVQSSTSGNTDNVTDVQSGTSGNTEDELLDDATIEEGDSMMC